MDPKPQEPEAAGELEPAEVRESRARLIRGFGHDLKNPLGAAEGHAYLLEEEILGGLSPRQKESVARIRRSIRSAIALIDDLLELARAEAGEIKPQYASTDIAEVVSDIVGEYRAQAEAAGLTLRTTPPENGLVTETDPVRLNQIVSNLVLNAIKYTSAGSVEVHVDRHETGGTPTAGPAFAVSVIDTGPGVPPEHQERIFQEFTRLDPNARKGAGLGLAISRKIARALDGDLTLESKVGQGSTFTLWLPLP